VVPAHSMPRTSPAYDVADLALAEAGDARIAWADAQMPVLRSIRERFGRGGALAGVEGMR
jgi:adenosylhomocysteinase